jgi:hypothetical protein
MPSEWSRRALLQGLQVDGRICSMAKLQPARVDCKITSIPTDTSMRCARRVIGAEATGSTFDAHQASHWLA